MNYNLSKPMNWATYKSMPTDLQREYISDLHEKYNVNACVLSEMFGVVAATVRLYFKENFPDITFSRGSRQTEEQRSAWESFCMVLMKKMRRRLLKKMLQTNRKFLSLGL